MVKFWGKKPEASGDAPTESAEPTPDGAGDSLVLEQEAALDQLAAILRIWGRHAFDLDDLNATIIRQQFELWARHVLVIAAAPTSRAESPNEAESTAPPRRDWPGLREFITRLRRREQAHVVRQIRDTHQVIGDFVQTLVEILAEDQEEQKRVTAVVNNLRQAIEGNAPLAVLSQETMRAIHLIGRIAEERNQRHQTLFQELTGKLQTLRGELDEARREMELDPLTRLYNRKAFDEHLERVFELGMLSGQPACLLMLDVDHFKDINDRFGHPVGDLVLKRLADCCLHAFPRKDDFVARYGGEEFIIVLRETPLRTAVKLGERLLRAIRELRVKNDQVTLSFTASIGVAELDPHASPGQWLREADSALYQAKRTGRDRIECQTAGS
jgi:diguanylate cyclase